ncbi:hypothetical protein [Pantoea sp.]|uniref:hypothetical protein n=1 Tax=Pantoea sp. TaxID=69393 RepID=UPI0028AEC61A|nr:hypothetical protein [Pantoea sp.]
MLSTSIESYRKSAISTLHQHNNEITKKLPTITHVTNRDLQSDNRHTTTLLSNRSSGLGSQHPRSRVREPDFPSLRHEQNLPYKSVDAIKRPMPKLFFEAFSEPAQKVKNTSEHVGEKTVSSILKNTARKSIIKKSIISASKKNDGTALSGNEAEKIKATTLKNIRTDGYWNNNGMDLAIYGVASEYNVQLDIEDNTARDNRVYLYTIGQADDPMRIIRLRRVRKEGHEHYQLIGRRESTIDVKNDGNCLFRAIALAMSNDEENYPEVRERTARHIEENWDEYKDYATTEQENIEYYAENKRFIALWESLKTTAEKKLKDWSKFSGSENDLIRVLIGGIAEPEKILQKLSNRDLQNLGYSSRILNKTTEVFIAKKKSPLTDSYGSLNGIPCTTKEGATLCMDLELLAKFDERVSFIDNEGLEGVGELIYFKRHIDNWYAMVHEAQKIIMWQGNYLPRQLISKFHTDYPINPRALFITNFPLDHLYELANKESTDAHRDWYNTVLQQNLVYFNFLDEHHPQ